MSHDFWPSGCGEGTFGRLAARRILPAESTATAEAFVAPQSRTMAMCFISPEKQDAPNSPRGSMNRGVLLVVAVLQEQGERQQAQRSRRPLRRKGRPFG
jgi:hypothetical protein